MLVMNHGSYFINRKVHELLGWIGIKKKKNFQARGSYRNMYIAVRLNTDAPRRSTAPTPPPPIQTYFKTENARQQME
jgi:hypothetical protein